MAKLYSKTVEQTTFACYSERGIVGYFFLRVLPTDTVGFLRQIENGAGTKPFASLQLENTSDLTIFSELHFGSKYGFGNPDGAVFFKVDGQPCLCFYEAKFNETYRQSCNGKSYNSTIQGQLELKWRLLNLFHHSSFQTEKGRKYVVETNEFADFYASDDPFYSLGKKQRPHTGLGAYRHLCFKGGVKTIFDKYVNDVKPDRVFFVISTKDDNNPFTDSATKRPRCFGKTWDEVKRQFCWINNEAIENCPSL